MITKAFSVFVLFVAISLSTPSWIHTQDTKEDVSPSIPDKVTLQLLWKHQFEFAGFYVAQEKGFFRDLGLDVRIKEYDFGMDVTGEVLSEKADFGTGYSTLILDKMNGKEVFLLSAIYQHSPLVLLAKKRPDLTKVADLKGKKIMSTDLDAGSASLIAMLKSNGVLQNDYTRLDHTFNVDDLISGKTDAMTAYLSNQPYLMEKKGVPYTTFYPKDHGFDFYGDILFTSQKLFQENPQLVKRFYQASLQGWEYAFSHIDETVELIFKKYNTQNKSRDALLYEANVLKKMAFDEGIPLGFINEDRIRQIAQVYRLLGITEQFGNLDNLFYKPSRLPDIGLTAQEKLFLTQHPIIRVHNESSWAPYNFYENGRPRGFSIDFMKLLSEKLGIQMEFINGPSWGEFIEMIKDKKLDVMLNIAQSPERQKYLNFSNSYFQLAQALFIRDDMERIHSIEELYGKRFAIPKSFFFEETLLKYSQIQLVTVKDTAGALQAVAFGQADALLDLIPVVQYYKRKLAINNVVLGGTLDLNEGEAIPLYIGVRKDWPELPSIFNKAIFSIDDKEFREIESKWLNYNLQEEGISKLNFTEQEKTWLKDHPIIKVHNELSWAPFNFNKDGIPLGYSIDYMNLLANRIGIEVEYISGEWGPLLQQVFDKKLDVMLNIVKTPERMKRLLYADSYAKNPNVIIAKESSSITDIHSLIGKKIAYPEGFFYDEILRTKFPNIIRVPKKNTLESLKAVYFDQADATLGELAVTRYFMRENLLTGLAIKGEFDVGDPELEKLNIAVRNDWPELQSILKKAMLSISMEENNELQKKWIVFGAEGGKNDTKSAIRTSAFEKKSRDVVTQEIIIQGILFILVVTLVLGSLYFVAQRRYGDSLVILFQSKKIIWVGPILISLFLIIIIIITEFALKEIEQQSRHNSVDSLQSVVDSTHEALSVWVENYRQSIQQLANDSKLVTLTKEQLQVPRTKQSLLNSSSLKEIRDFIYVKRQGYRDTGFFIITPDNISIASMRDTNIGITNLIAEHRPTLLEEAFKGKTIFIPPVQSDVLLESNSDRPNQNPSTMFFATPIKDASGDVIAVLALRVDPTGDFTQLVQAGRIGLSGETYAFDEKGLFISESRFEDQLQEIGLISENEQEILNLKVSDPGGNLLEGYQSLDRPSNQSLTVMAKNAVSGQSGSNVDGYRDYRGVRVLGAWIWDEKLHFGLTTEIDEQEALTPFYTTRIIVIAVLGMTVFLSVLLTAISLWFGRRANTVLIRSRDELEEKVKNRTEELKEAKEIAEDATKAKGDFLANMSHEIRTPMNAIMGMTHLCLQTELTSKQQDYLNKVHGSATALLGLINDILDFSKIEAGKLDMETVPFALTEVLENVSTLIALKAQDKGLELLFQVAPDAPLNIIGDPLRLGQVLINLANNAVKFTQEGEIVISIKFLEEKDPDFVTLQFTVRDTGIGLTEEQIGKLFQSFSQADSSTSRKYGGTGLGLTISKRLVEMMAGKIWVESVAGQGSSFIFTATFGHQKQETVEKKQRASEMDLQGMRVLVVDDNETSRIIFQETLESFSFHVDCVESGDEALTRLENTDDPYRLVLMDWKMPGMDGITAAERIRHLSLKSFPKVILATAFGREEIRQQAENIGVDGFLTKPASPSVLLDTIMEVFGERVSQTGVARKKHGSEKELLKGIRGAQILLVEDNEINQQIARELLEGAGLIVTIAHDGKEGVEKAKVSDFDAVLMDIQMPVMDGYEASQEIRKDPSYNDLPIIAMTANAMAGDREKALNAGMNDHVAKPIDPKQLFKTLVQWVKPGERSVEEPNNQETEKQEADDILPPSLPGIDITTGLSRVSGNTNLYRKLLNKFQSNQASTIDQIKTALEKEDFELAERLAHTIKGVAGNIGAMELHTTASDLETEIKETPLNVSTVILESVQSHLDQVMFSIQELNNKQDDIDSDFKGEMDLQTIEPLIRELSELLEDDDTEATEVLEKLMKQLNDPEIIMQLKQVEQLVGEYDFEEALEQLENVALALNITINE